MGGKERVHLNAFECIFRTHWDDRIMLCFQILMMCDVLYDAHEQHFMMLMNNTFMMLMDMHDV